MRTGRWGALAVAAALLITFVPRSTAAGATAAAAMTASCTASLGPGIPPPASVRSGIPGFHATWYGQSGYPTLCVGQRVTATVAFYNSGSRGWVSGRAGETALLGRVAVTDPDGRPLNFPADPSWPAADRVSVQPATYVGPGQVAWFQFTVTAPASPGRYRFYIRPLIEGVEWMEDEGVYWELNVVAARPDTVAVIPATSSTATVGTDHPYTAVSSEGSCIDLALINGSDTSGEDVVPDIAGHAKFSSAGALSVTGTTTSATYIDCAPVGSDHLLRFTMRATAAGELRPVVFDDRDGDNTLDVSTEPYALGGAVRSLPADATQGAHLVVVGSVNVQEHYLIDTLGTAIYRYNVNDRFQRGAIPLTVAWFEQLVSRGDVLNVSYDPGISSTFTFLEDVGRRAVTLNAALDSWDGGPTQNDIGITVTEPPSNVDGLVYALERAKALYGTTCDDSAGAYNPIASIVIASGDETRYIDRDLAVGAYCYRIGVSDPLSAETAFSYTTRLVVNNPPSPVVRPRSVDARLLVSGGVPATFDAGDVIKVAFDKALSDPIGATLRLVDTDGTTVEIRCGIEAACSLNRGVELLGGIVYGVGKLITIEMRAAPREFAAGSSSGLATPATVVASDLRDFAGNAWNVTDSDDVIVGAPD